MIQVGTPLIFETGRVGGRHISEKNGRVRVLEMCLSSQVALCPILGMFGPAVPLKIPDVLRLRLPRSQGALLALPAGHA